MFLFYLFLFFIEVLLIYNIVLFSGYSIVVHVGWFFFFRLYSIVGYKILGKITQKTKNKILGMIPYQSGQSLSRVQFFETSWTAAHQASLSITSSKSLLKLMSIESIESYIMIPYTIQ